MTTSGDDVIRPDKALKYFELAKFQANLFSKDPSTKVGALFLAPKSFQVLCQGFNGFPRNIDETKEERWARPEKLKWISHAEANCISNACRHGTPLEGCIAVVTMFPCISCAKLMIQAGVSFVVTKYPDFGCERWGEEFKFSHDMFKEAGVNIIYIDHAK